MKNLLSENMMRFGTKNLTESAKKELVLKSIIETIDQHGLQLEVRQALTEADAPAKDFAFPDSIEFNEDDLKKIGVKFKAPIPDVAKGYGEISFGPLVWQSNTSLTEASAILQELIKILASSGTENGPLLAKALGQITANNYYAILWKVRYGSSFRSITKSNYKTITDWISKKGFDIPSAGHKSGTDDVGAGNPAGVIRNLFQDPTVFNAVNRLKKYNSREGRTENIAF